MWVTHMVNYVYLFVRQHSDLIIGLLLLLVSTHSNHITDCGRRVWFVHFTTTTKKIMYVSWYMCVYRVWKRCSRMLLFSHQLEWHQRDSVSMCYILCTKVSIYTQCCKYRLPIRSCTWFLTYKAYHE